MHVSQDCDNNPLSQSTMQLSNDLASYSLTTDQVDKSDHLT